jgi:hypothetical protein
MADHSDLESPRLTALLNHLIDLNETEDPSVRLKIVADIEAARRSRGRRNEERDERHTTVDEPVPRR